MAITFSSPIFLLSYLFKKCHINYLNCLVPKCWSDRQHALRWPSLPYSYHPRNTNDHLSFSKPAMNGNYSTMVFSYLSKIGGVVCLWKLNGTVTCIPFDLISSTYLLASSFDPFCCTFSLPLSLSPPFLFSFWEKSSFFFLQRKAVKNMREGDPYYHLHGLTYPPSTSIIFFKKQSQCSIVNLFWKFDSIPFWIKDNNVNFICSMILIWHWNGFPKTKKLTVHFFFSARLKYCRSSSH